MTERLVGLPLSSETNTYCVLSDGHGYGFLQAGFSPSFFPGSLVSILYTTGLIPVGFFVLLFHSVTPGLLPVDYHGYVIVGFLPTDCYTQISFSNYGDFKFYDFVFRRFSIFGFFSRKRFF